MVGGGGRGRLAQKGAEERGMLVRVEVGGMLMSGPFSHPACKAQIDLGILLEVFSLRQSSRTISGRPAVQQGGGEGKEGKG
jgi:hypothetical protein